MPYQPVDVVEVRCWGSRVGAIALDERSGFYVFEYEPAWAQTRVELAPTSMPTGAGTRSFIFPALPPETYQRLPPMVADSLPDEFGNALTTAYLANEGVARDEITALDRLAYLGTRGVGALEFHPGRGPRTRKATAIELSELVAAARNALSGETTTDEGITDALARLIAVGTSAGGARAKAVVAIDPATGELRSGQVPAPPGFEPWVVKLDGVDRDGAMGATGSYGRVEYGYHLMATAAGIDMTGCRLIEEGGRAHFMTRRFDRTPDGTKVHAQTLCALGQLDFRQIGTHDYAQLFLMVEQLGLPVDARTEVFRRMVFNVAAANCDDHTKNVSFLLPRGERWRLSPAYDVTHSYASASGWVRQHLMAVNGRTTAITRADVTEVGDRFGVPAVSDSIERVLDAVSGWATFADEAGVPDATARSIARDIELWSSPLR
ncbi:MAG: type II toxin-antitoxin system HipA family toxin [Actinomycetota bacterium]